MPDFIMVYVLGAAAIGAIAGSLLTWTANQYQEAKYERAELKAQIAELQKHVAELSRPRRFWYEEGRMDERIGLLAAAQLLKLSVQDGLDALRRLSPQLADEVVNDVMRPPKK